MEKVKELHSIKKFRVGNLGIIRLNELAYSQDIIIKIGDEEFYPIGYDTYGHPVISEENFIYYKALKAIKERAGESLVPEVEYIAYPFVIKREIYDSVEGISKIETDFPEEEKLRELKKILIFRKRAHFIGRELNTFILYGKYALYSDGHIYMCSYKKKNMDEPDKPVLDISEVIDFELKEEVHIPGEEDTCSICRKKFNISDIKNLAATEDSNCRKSHKKCLKNYTEAVNYKKASQIVDSVYQESPESEVITEYDNEGQKERIWYLYHTKQGDIGIRFKNKVIEIKWFGNFKPFKLEKLFEEEDVTKKKLEDSKIIHAWSVDDAIKYLSMVKKS